MDLIILQPGDEAMLPSENTWKTGGSLVDNIPGAEPSYPRENPPLDWQISTGNKLKTIELVSVHQGMKQQMTTDVSNSARTSGRPVITEFTCVKYVDKTSVKFYDYCLRAKPMGSGVKQPTKIYICRNSGDQTLNIMTFWLRDAMISEIQFQSHPDDMPTEQFKINFTEIMWEYSIQNADTTLGGKVSSAWSLAHNRPITAFTP